MLFLYPYARLFLKLFLSRVLLAINNQLTNGQTDRPMNQPIDKAAYRVACARIKKTSQLSIWARLQLRLRFGPKVAKGKVRYDDRISEQALCRITIFKKTIFWNFLKLSYINRKSFLFWFRLKLLLNIRILLFLNSGKVRLSMILNKIRFLHVS